MENYEKSYFSLIPFGLLTWRKENEKLSALTSVIESNRVFPSIQDSSEDKLKEDSLKNSPKTKGLLEQEEEKIKEFDLRDRSFMQVEINPSDWPVLDLYLNQGMKQKEISKVLRIRYHKVYSVIVNFKGKYIYKDRKKDFWINRAWARQILVKEMKKILEENRNRPISSIDIRQILEHWFPEMKIPSVISLWTFIKRYLGYSFHKASIIHLKDWTDEALKLKACFIMLITSLERHRVKLVYLDEFCIH